MMVENLLEPPEDEIEVDDENEGAVEKEMKHEVTQVKDDKMKHVKFGKNYTENCKNETAAKEEIKAKDLKVKIENKENDSDEERETEDVSKNLYDEIVPESVSIDDVIGMHDMKYMQVHSGTGKKDKVDRRMDASTFVSFLIFAMLLICGKTLHEQSRQITRLSKLSQPSLFSQLQPEVLLSLTSSCSCQAESGVCCEVTTALTVKASSMASKVSAVVTWFRQTWVAVYGVTERPTAGITTAMLDMVARIASTACAVNAWLKRTLWRFVL